MSSHDSHHKPTQYMSNSLIISELINFNLLYSVSFASMGIDMWKLMVVWGILSSHIVKKMTFLSPEVIYSSARSVPYKLLQSGC